MRRDKIKHPGPPAPPSAYKDDPSQALPREDFYALAAEWLSWRCEGCQVRKARNLPYQVMPVIRSEVSKLEDLLEEGRISEALSRVEHPTDWRYKRPELAAALLGKAREVLPGDPHRSREWASLGEKVSLHGTSARHRERRAQALAYIGNSYRALSDLGQAREFFEASRRELEDGVETPEVGADIDILESSLARDERRPAEAEQLLRRALVVQLSEGMEVPAARTLISLSIPYLRRGDTVMARALLVSALPALEDAEDRSLRILALGNLCLCDTRDENYRSASVRFTELSAQVQGGSVDRFTMLRMGWLEARISAGLGEEIHALDLFRTAFEEMMSQGASYDALLVALDWVRVATRSGQENDIRHVAGRLQQIAEKTPELRTEFHEAIEVLVRYLVEGVFTEAAYWIFERCFWKRRQ